MNHTNSFSFTKNLLFFLLTAFLGSAACAHKKTESTQETPPQVQADLPRGPTRTDFKTIASKLVKRCIAGGWISKWRSEQEDIDIARPKIFVLGFQDQTGEYVDASYLRLELERRLKLSNVFEMVGTEDQADFLADGTLMALAEEGLKPNERFRVYTATLRWLNPSTKAMAYSCEATVR